MKTACFRFTLRHMKSLTLMFCALWFAACENKSATCQRAACGRPAAGCQYVNGNVCDCGTLVCTDAELDAGRTDATIVDGEVTDTTLGDATLGDATRTDAQADSGSSDVAIDAQECNPIIDCAAPPEGCNYVGGNTCRCGTLQCGLACGDTHCLANSVCIESVPGQPGPSAFDCHARDNCTSTSCVESGCSAECRALCPRGSAISISGDEVRCIGQ